MGSVSDKIEFRVLIKDRDSYYYILKVEHRDSETFCFFLMQYFISQNIKVVKPISKPKETKKDLQKESQLLLLLVRQGNRAVAASNMRLQKI